MKRLFLILPFLCFPSLTAQVEDISFTLTPTAEYVWWDDQTGLADDFLYGGKVGFGFGEYLELSGIFQTSTNLQTDFSSFGLENFSNETFEVQDVTLMRYGGELKVNFSKGVFSPYMTLGTGIQSIELNENKFEQIYAGFGLGLRLALSDRINLLVEGKATGFNIDAANNLLSAANQNEYNVNTTDFTREETLNIGASAALQIYLGGRKPGELSELDKAYLKKYRGGFQGWGWVIEPSLAYVNFDSDSFYRNTWMAGGYFGVDFTDFVGVRAYYLQAMEDESISTDFDGLNTYGLEFRAKLNDGRGVNPYLILGGGYLNIASDYEGAVDGLGAQSTGFANAGLGLDIPLGRNVLITGGARAMATSTREVSNPVGPDVLQAHVMYTAGIKIQVGKKPETPEEVVENGKNELDNIDTEISEKDRMDYERIRKLVREYQQELRELDEEIEKAYQRKDTRRAIDLLEEKKRVSKELRDVQKIERMYQRRGLNSEGEYLKMTPEEFEDLIDRILQGIDEKYNEENVNKKSSDAGQVNNQALILQIMKLRQEVAQQNLGINQKIEEYQSEAQNDKKPNSDSLNANAKTEKEMELILERENERQEQIDKKMEDLDSRIEEFNKQIQTQQNELAKAKEEKVAAEKKAAEEKEAKEKMEAERKEAEKKLKEQEEKAKEEKAKMENAEKEAKAKEPNTSQQEKE